MEQLLLEKPFTDPNELYTVTSSKEQDCFNVHNLETGKTYTVNPFKGFCSCESFKYQTNGGSCKHIEFLRNNERIKPLIEKYKEQRQQIESNNANNPNIQEYPETSHLLVGDHDGVGEQSPFAIMERRDENQIMEELIRSNVIKEYVYDFQQNGHRVTGLSYSGVIHVALKLGHIHTGEPIIQEMNEGYLAKVPATDMKRNVSTWGVSFQPQKMTLRDGREITDKFAIQKAVAKANRNAMRHLFPEKIVIGFLNKYREDKK